MPRARPCELSSVYVRTPVLGWWRWEVEFFFSQQFNVKLEDVGSSYSPRYHTDESSSEWIKRKKKNTVQGGRQAPLNATRVNKGDCRNVLSVFELFTSYSPTRLPKQTTSYCCWSFRVGDTPSNRCPPLLWTTITRGQTRSVTCGDPLFPPARTHHQHTWWSVVCFGRAGDHLIKCH